MSGSRLPNEPPPSYSQATGSSSASAGPSAGNASHNDPMHLGVPGSSGKGNNNIPAEYRRSMEDEGRPLPEGWVRTYDPKTNHQFFVDTTKEPPKSMWHHPYDDDEYLASLPAEERERIEQDAINRHKNPSKEDIIGAHSDDDDDDHHHAGSSSNAELPPRPQGKGKQPDSRTFGRKFKDKVTGTTHEERVEERRQRAEAEQRMYEQHLRIRQAMQKAAQTGQPQLLGKDRDGKDVYIEPPPPVPQGAFGGYPGGGYSSYSPYNSGIYTTPNARYIRPQAPYQRGYGGYGYGGGYGGGYGRPGFGGGYGAPLAIGGGLLGGLLLGDLLF